MKTKFIYPLFIALSMSLSGLVFTGCAKAEKETEDPANTGGVVTPVSEFDWTPNGSSAVTASESYYIPAYNNIVATKGGGSSYVDITLDNLNVGAHTISPSAGITAWMSSPSTASAARRARTSAPFPPSRRRPWC